MQSVDATSADPSTVHWGMPNAGCADPVGSPPNREQLLNDSDDCPAPEPLWDGNDHFWARYDNFASGQINFPEISDSTAYVASDVLVSKLPEGAQFRFFAGTRGNLVRFGTGYAIHPFQPGTNRQRMQNIAIAGRYPAATIIGAAVSVGICPSDCVRPGDITDQSCAYNLLLESIDTFADVLEARNFSEPVDPTRACNALSMATLFQEGVLGRFEGLAPSTASEQLPNLCP
jgi:hypothetical protein